MKYYVTYGANIFGTDGFGSLLVDLPEIRTPKISVETLEYIKSRAENEVNATTGQVSGFIVLGITPIEAD